MSPELMLMEHCAWKTPSIPVFKGNYVYESLRYYYVIIIIIQM